MELNPPGWVVLMLYSHDFSIRCLGSYCKRGGQGGWSKKQGVVASGGKRIGQPFKQISVLVMNRGGFTMHEPVRSDNASSICLSNTLMPKTYPK